MHIYVFIYVSMNVTELKITHVLCLNCSLTDPVLHGSYMVVWSFIKKVFLTGYTNQTERKFVEKCTNILEMTSFIEMFFIRNVRI